LDSSRLCSPEGAARHYRCFKRLQRDWYLGKGGGRRLCARSGAGCGGRGNGNRCSRSMPWWALWWS